MPIQYMMGLSMKKVSMFSFRNQACKIDSLQTQRGDNSTRSGVYSRNGTSISHWTQSENILE